VSLGNSRRLSHRGITTTSGVGEVSLGNSRRLSHRGITITSGVGEVLVRNIKRTSQQYNHYIWLAESITTRRSGNILAVPGVTELPLSNFGRPNHSGINITPSIKKMPLSFQEESHGGMTSVSISVVDEMPLGFEVASLQNSFLHSPCSFHWNYRIDSCI
jgi:hypothetical protein